MKRVLILLGLTLGWASSGFAANANPVGDAAAGKSNTAVCGACHGADGNSMAPFPKLAGQGEKYLLKQLNNIVWRKNGNTISATNKDDSSIHMTLHIHDDSGTLWYKKPEIIDHFLWFVGECNPDLKEQISKVNKKS